MVRKYPQLEVDLSILRSNARQVITHCQQQGIRVCGVVKGVDGLPEVARAMRLCGAEELGTSRLEQVERCRAAGVGGPWLLIRIPGQDPPGHRHGRSGRPAGGLLGQG